MNNTLKKYTELVRACNAVLYDFDEVLVNSEKFYFRSYSREFLRFGHSINMKEYWKYWTCLGEGVKGEIRRHNLKLTQKDIDSINRGRFLNYSEFIEKGKIKFIPESFKTISLFQKIGKKTIIASNSHETNLRRIFEVNKRKATLPIIGRRPGLKTKPHPDIFIYAAGYLRVNPGDCLVIEDARKGLVAAKSAGMACVIIRNRYNREFEFPEADLIINSYKEFLDLTRKCASV